MYKDRFINRTAIITGGASGLGKATARRLVKEGAKVEIWDISSAAAEEARHELGASSSASVDVSDANAVEEATKRAHTELGSVDLLLCSAGITGATESVWEFPLDSWERTIAINLSGVFNCCRAIVPIMIKSQYGRILNVASVAGKEGNPNACAYSASKAGVIAFTKSLAKELADKGITANSLAPAAFESPLFDQMPQSQIDYMLSKIPMGRLGTLEENAAMACFALSEECGFTTGATFDTSGGRLTY